MIEVRSNAGLEAVYTDEKRDDALGYVGELRGIGVKAWTVDAPDVTEAQIQAAGWLHVEQAEACEDYIRFAGDRPELYAIFVDPAGKWRAVEARADRARKAVAGIAPAVKVAMGERLRALILAKKAEG